MGPDRVTMTIPSRDCRRGGMKLESWPEVTQKCFKGGPMKKTASVLVFASLFVLSIAAQPQQPTRSTPEWAFPVTNGALPAEPAGTRTVPDSKRTFLSTQIDDLLN